jgi:hypothetical protein
LDFHPVLASANAPRGLPLAARTVSVKLRAVTAPTFTFDVLLYGLCVIGLFAALWIYYDRRDRALYDAGRRKISFHCIRCEHLYTQPAGTETAPCPKCGHVNVRLKF